MELVGGDRWAATWRGTQRCDRVFGSWDRGPGSCLRAPGPGEARDPRARPVDRGAEAPGHPAAELRPLSLQWPRSGPHGPSRAEAAVAAKALPLFPKLPAGPRAGPPATCSLRPAPHALLALSLGSEWAAEAKARSGQSCCASLEAIWPGAWALGYPPHWLSDCPLPAPCTGLHGGDRRPSRMGGCPWEKDGGF